MSKPAGTRQGFTIVELLIVVIVIAILATISIVAYNGITGRAKASAAASAAEQAAKKVMIYMTTNGDQVPPDLATAGVTNQGGTTYQYSSNSSASPQTFCLTATTANVSYWVNNSNQGTPTTGACAGQAPNGGTVVTNIAISPEATSYLPNGNVLGWNTNRWFGYQTTGSYSIVTGASDGPVGLTTYARKTWTSTPSSYNNTGDTGFDNGTQSGTLMASSGQTWTFSCYLRPSVHRSLEISIYLYDSTNTFKGRDDGPSIDGPANQWTRVSSTITIPANIVSVGVSCDSNNANSSNMNSWTYGSTLDGTALMVTQGSTPYNYADGNSPGWIWNGTPNNSTSTGPAL